ENRERPFEPESISRGDHPLRQPTVNVEAGGEPKVRRLRRQVDAVGGEEVRDVELTLRGLEWPRGVGNVALDQPAVRVDGVQAKTVGRPLIEGAGLRTRDGTDGLV